MRLELFCLIGLLITVVAGRELTRSEYDSIQENYILPTRTILVYLLFYGFAVFLLNCPPETLTAMGITTENLFSGYLGSQDPDIVTYHCRRIVLNRGLLGFYPFFFFLILCFLEDSAIIFTFTPSRLLHNIANLSVLLMISAFTWMVAQHLTNFYYVRPSHLASMNMMELNRQISTEMMDLASFKYNVSSSSKLVITQSWIVFSSRFSFQIVRLEEASLHVVRAEEIILDRLLPEGAVQMMTIRIAIPPTCGSDIIIKMHNLTLQDLRSTVNARVDIPQNIVMRLSTVERFARIFAEEAAKNPPYLVGTDIELEPCLACAEKPANMKLVKTCHNQAPEGAEEPMQERIDRCMPCNCRPMWCVHCMGKVFAAKQDPQQMAMWIFGKAPCPTCRATFCIFDVAMVETRTQ